MTIIGTNSSSGVNIPNWSRMDVQQIVKNPNYRGITTPFWHNLKEVGDWQSREIFGTPYCGKGEPNQAIEVGHASPACLFENIEVFGGV